MFRILCGRSLCPVLQPATRGRWISRTLPCDPFTFNSHITHTQIAPCAPLTCTPALQSDPAPPQGNSAASRRRRFCSDKRQPLFSATLLPVCDNPHGPDNLKQEIKRKRRPFCVSECSTKLTLPVANTDIHKVSTHIVHKGARSHSLLSYEDITEPCCWHWCHCLTPWWHQRKGSHDMWWDVILHCCVPATVVSFCFIKLLVILPLHASTFMPFNAILDRK